jgi:hypothetical protein
MSDRQNQNHNNKNNRLRMYLISKLAKGFGTQLEFYEKTQSDNGYHNNQSKFRQG